MEKKKKPSAFQKVANLTIYPYAAKALKKKYGRNAPAIGVGGATAKAARKAAKKKY